jgi:energy-coupling factor transporter ATP-binding protein EcfA2
MKTEISRFCEACVTLLEPLLPRLDSALEDLGKSGPSPLIERPEVELGETRARLRSLLEKLCNQQAYLLIFGPLKSGKSTLMNAISGAYVSEVTSLPGYPCLVFVRHGPEPHFSVTRYNGRESTFTDGGVLKDVIADSHFALAEQIRTTEKRGEAFDPREHFTEAIRRVDIRLPVPALAESSTVLVDTPGLYSRMNFGYDVLTREFRDSAACAVFVVKTDNLFLEQVFVEFNQLLDLFSRIFLVVNVDSSKRDLQPDGSLQPSAESARPEQIIEAFTTLSMAGPLRRAYEEGRVRLHAVDLLNAASAFLSKPAGNNGSGTPAGGANGSTDIDAVASGATDVAAPARFSSETAASPAFAEFLRDLTDYLNSSDYTREFIGDSLRQGSTLCTEALAVCDGRLSSELGEQQVSLERQMEAIDQQLDATGRLLAVDWGAAFAHIRPALSERVDAVITARTAQLGKDMADALDRWLAEDDCLLALQNDAWSLLMIETGRALNQCIREELEALFATPTGGAEPGAAVMTDLHAVGLQLGPVGQGAIPALRRVEEIDPFRGAIPVDEIPVRKTLGDLLLFRRIRTVRRRLFGEDLTMPVSSQEKARRLREPSRTALGEIRERMVAERFPRLPEETAGKLIAGYTTRFRADIVSTLERHREYLRRERTARQEPFDANARLLAALDTLRATSAKVASELAALAEAERIELPATLAGPRAPAADSESFVETMQGTPGGG